MGKHVIGRAGLNSCGWINGWELCGAYLAVVESGDIPHADGRLGDGCVFWCVGEFF